MIRLNPFLYFGLALVGVLAGVSCTSPSGTSKKQPPNVILILTDDQGWGDLSFHGNELLSTPNIDRLAQQGASFSQFFVSAVCSPTRAELLTGRYAVRGGVYSTSQGGERLDLDETTLADVFNAHGYKTAAFGKWHSGMQYPYHPNGRGFDEYYGFCSGHWGNYFSPMLEHNGKIVKGEGFLPDDLTNHAIDFISENQDQPFFLYLPFNTPHAPMQVPAEWWEKHEGQVLDKPHRYKEKEYPDYTRAAYALCENIDANVGRITQQLEELGLDENTIVIYLSDNGPNGWRWNNEMKGKKGHTDEGGVKSPLFVQWKGQIQAGKVIPQLASALDFLPTLAELCGIDYQSQKPLDGKSIAPLLLTENPEWEDRTLANYWRGNLSMRNERFRLDTRDSLYDIQADLGQYHEVSAKYPEVYQELLAKKQQWQEEVLPELPKEDLRTFPVGHKDFVYTQLPARDAQAFGGLKRSNRWPNDSYFSNWTSLEDSLVWEVEVAEAGSYQVELYYTCSEENIGSEVALSMGENKVQTTLSTPHDPPFVHLDQDRATREVSPVKEFLPINMGSIQLEKGRGKLVLKALTISNKEVMDFRLLMLTRKG